MKQHLHAMTYLVRDYDEAVLWFTEMLGFELIEDSDLGSGKRWVLVQPKGGGASLLLARATTPEQAAAIGKQTGGRVMMFLHTDNFTRDYKVMQTNGVTFVEEPRHEAYGSVVVFKDLYGQKWDLIERK